MGRPTQNERRIQLCDIGAACYYCGAHSTQWDHPLPVVFGGDDRVVRACAECNNALNDNVFATMGERCLHVALWLKSRHSSLLRAPSWTDEELEELGPRLRSRIRSELRDRDRLRARIEHALERAEEP